jgi:hypothetical protein
VNVSKKALAVIVAGILIGSIMVGWAARDILWDWTGTVEEISIEHYTDSGCGTLFGSTYDSPSATDGDFFTSYVRNEGTVAVTLTITVDNAENTWITATHDYTGATIAVDAGITIRWTLDIDSGHEGDSFTLSITINAIEA